MINGDPALFGNARRFLSFCSVLALRQARGCTPLAIGQRRGGQTRLARRVRSGSFMLGGC
jgi:hypothetical protein